MKVSELIKKAELEILTDKNFSDREVSGCYIGDLLSWVMANAKEGDAWITIMNSINIVAVASLTGTASIILCESVLADDDVITKANDEGIIILGTDKTAYEIAKVLSGEI